MTQLPNLKEALLLTFTLTVSSVTWANQPHALYSKEQLRSDFSGCQHLFPGKNSAYLEGQFGAAIQPRGLCSDQFAVLHSGVLKSPLLVVERLNAAMLRQAKGLKRTDDFYPDPRLPAKERSSLNDFKGSGYDRGHLAPAANMSSPRAMAQSFALSNMIPQDPVNNQKIWNKLESDTRKFVERAAGDVIVMSGVLYAPDNARAPTKAGTVPVPDHLYKLVLDEATGRTWVHVLPNSADARIGKPLSYPEFVRTTGLHLLPAQASN